MSAAICPTPPPDDPLRELAARAAAGDPAATESLISALAPRVVSVCRRALGSPHADLDDAIQDTLIAIVRNLPSFRGECTVLHYATCAAVRTCLGVRRRYSRRARLDELRFIEDESFEPSSDALAVSARQREILRDFMAALPPNLSETLALRIVGGLSLADVATTMGIPVNTVRSRVRLAKEGLRKMIENDPVATDLLKEPA